MALTETDLAYLRSEVGAEPSDDDLDAAFVRLGSLEAVALEVVKGRLSTLAAEPASLAVEGYSQSTAANMSTLEKQQDRLRKQVNNAIVVIPLGRGVPTR